MNKRDKRNTRMSGKTVASVENYEEKEAGASENKEDLCAATDPDEREIVEDLTDDTFSLNLEEDKKTKTVDNESETECQTPKSDNIESPIPVGTMLTRKGTYVLSNSSVKDITSTNAARYSTEKYIYFQNAVYA